jgi:hypothetical protein
VWTETNWGGKFSVSSGTVASVSPTFLAGGEADGTYSWSVTFSSGGQTITKSFTVMAGSATPVSDFIDNGDGTVTPTSITSISRTGLLTARSQLPGPEALKSVSSEVELGLHDVQGAMVISQGNGQVFPFEFLALLMTNF